MSHIEPLKQAIDRDDAQAALAILNQQALLNQYCLPFNGGAFTPVGYAAYYNKLKCLEAISSMAGVDLSRGYDYPRGRGGGEGGALHMALLAGHIEAAKILARKGAACTEEEIGRLGHKYTNFQQIIQQEAKLNAGAAVRSSTEEVEQPESSKGERGIIRHWVDSFEFEKLKEWLGKSKKQLEGQWEAGEVPVVGWLQLEATFQTTEASKINLQAELEQIAKEQEQLDDQMRKLQQQQEALGNRKQQLKVKMKKLDQIAALQAESQSIAFLSQMEQQCLAKLQKKMENPYFMEDLDQDDVSTVFSLFSMDLLFPKYKQHDQYKNLEVTASTAVETLQKDLKLDFSEAAELVWKLKLLEVGERGCARHLSKCSICSSTTAGALLQEYGMKAEEREKIEAKMKGWKGFYFAAANAASAAAELNVGAELAPKFVTCWMRIHKAHKWEHPDD